MYCVHGLFCCYFFFNDTATTEIYTLSLHDALPIFRPLRQPRQRLPELSEVPGQDAHHLPARRARHGGQRLPRRLRSEEHTSVLQSRQYLVCRLLLEKKKKNQIKSRYLHVLLIVYLI